MKSRKANSNWCIPSMKVRSKVLPPNSASTSHCSRNSSLVCENTRWWGPNGFCRRGLGSTPSANVSGLTISKEPPLIDANLQVGGRLQVFMNAGKNPEIILAREL